jgi:membrane protease YdiL (CAAX protease family)
MSVTSHAAVVAAVVVLALANVLNNRLMPAAYVLTSLVTTCVLLVLLRTAGVGWAQAGLDRDTVRRGLVWGLILILVVAACYLACALLPGARDLFLDRRVETAGPGRIVFEVLVRVPLGTVLLEEVAFRGVLYALVRSEYGVVGATVVSSGLFGLWHILPAAHIGTVNPLMARIFGAGPRGAALATTAAVVTLALAGWILCEVQRRSGGLLAPAALHWATNGFGYVTAYLVLRAAR